MTTRIYYTDPLARSFDATVLACDDRDGRLLVTLDETAFYPTSGGQPFDTGKLGTAAVLDVIDDEDGTIRHVVDAPLPPGTRVQGVIDWPRRLAHMQQHTGQHILSAAFDRLFAVRTVSFHLGAETSTIDLAREVSAGEIAQAEAEANRVVWDDRPVSVRFVSEEEAASLPLRKEPVRTGPLRLVEVTGFDLSACGGTHVPQTGMIGIIAVSSWERFKGGSRVGFVCGGRALASHGALRDVVSSATRVLSVSQSELTATIERLQSDVKDLARSVRKLQEEAAVTLSSQLRASAETIGPYRGVLRDVPGWDASLLKTLATAVVAEPGFVAVLTGTGQLAAGQPVPVVVARSGDVDLDAGAWMKRATAELGGRGGGRAELAQGGLPVSAERVLAFARESFG